MLYEKFGGRLVRYAYSRLARTGRPAGEAWVLAEDIVQSMWLSVARYGAADLLREEPWEEDEALHLLFIRVKRAMSEHFKVMRSSEEPVDWQDPVTCNTLCPLMPSGCVLAELPDYLTKLVARLPQREREALMLRLDGIPFVQMGERLGCSTSTADRLTKTAVLLLQIDNPELSGPMTALESLPEWEQCALADVSDAKRQVLLRMPPEDRQTILLKDQGLDNRTIAKRLGIDRGRVGAAAQCTPVLNALPNADVAVAA
ncbi:sigma factor-like helix-turn-helix DNA-binding protein [Streptomyces sp. NPDC007025]|uniref:sigma factor-like helix-turn-helix DNA-binding protein n=1 Tax=Streptomyces sp. NPDC007025 TaxID=3364771 RepID=UPI00367F22D9